MTREPLTLATYRPFPSHAIVVATMADNRLITRTYIGYSTQEAKRAFLRDLTQARIAVR